MNAGFSAEIAVLGLSIGLLLSLVCYLVSNLSPGGMITPGWLALVVVEEPRRLALLALVVLGTIVVMLGVRRVVILYGKRLFATVVMVAVFLQMTAFFVLMDLFPSTLETTTLGFIVPGLIAYQLIRQPVVATLGAIAAVTALSYGVMLAGVVFDLIPGLVAPTFASGNIELTPLRVGFILIAVLFGFVGVGIQMRRVRRPAAAPIAARAPRATVSTRESVDASEEHPPPPSELRSPSSTLAVPSHAPQGLEPVQDPSTTRKGRALPAIGVALVVVLLFIAGVAVGRAAAPRDDGPAPTAGDTYIDPGPRRGGAGRHKEGSDESDVAAIRPIPQRCLQEFATGSDALAVATVEGAAVVDLRTAATIPTGLRGALSWSASGRWLGSTSGHIVRRDGRKRVQRLFSGPVTRWKWAPRSDCAIGIFGDSLRVSSPGSPERDLVKGRAADLAFSPDGDTLAILTRGKRKRIFELKLRTGGLRAVGRVPSGSELLGRAGGGWLVTVQARLLHVAQRGVTPVGRARAARVVRCGGDGLVVDDAKGSVFRMSADTRLETLARGYRGVTCSPDGRYLAAVSSTDRLTVLDLDGDLRLQLEVAVPSGALLAWGPEGLSIASRQGRKLQLRLVRPGSTAAETIGTWRVHPKAPLQRLVDRSSGSAATGKP